MTSYHSLRSERPWSLRPSGLPSWYQSNVQDGSTDFDKKCRRAMDSIVNFLQHYGKLDIKETLKAGSVGKGTYYKDSSDLDCVVIANIKTLSPDARTGRYRRNILRKRVIALTDALRLQPFVVRAEKQNNLHLQVDVRDEDGDNVEVDILLTADNLCHGLQNIYEAMIAMRSENQRWVYHACLAPLQKEFVKSRPVKVKALIRLLKYWKSEYLHRLHSGGKLLNSYLLELLTIYAWERAGSHDEFDLGQGLKGVLNILAYELRSLRHYWTTSNDGNYTEETAERGIGSIRIRGYKKNPILLDPANPTNNVFGNYMQGIDKVSSIAQQTLQTPLLSEIHVGTNWK